MHLLERAGVPGVGDLPAALGRLLERFPGFEVDAAAGRFAPGGFVRRYESLPFTT